MKKKIEYFIQVLYMYFFFRALRYRFIPRAVRAAYMYANRDYYSVTRARSKDHGRTVGLCELLYGQPLWPVS